MAPNIHEDTQTTLLLHTALYSSTQLSTFPHSSRSPPPAPCALLHTSTPSLTRRGPSKHPHFFFFPRFRFLHSSLPPPPTRSLSPHTQTLSPSLSPSTPPPTLSRAALRASTQAAAHRQVVPPHGHALPLGSLRRTARPSLVPAGNLALTRTLDRCVHLGGAPGRSRGSISQRRRRLGGKPHKTGRGYQLLTRLSFCSGVSSPQQIVRRMQTCVLLPTVAARARGQDSDTRARPCGARSRRKSGSCCKLARRSSSLAW